ncbi:MAG: BolA family transcriptional regulator [Alphaproteobacteria bacterium]|nr:BolA family transcriptional regulator [Alphaproteobacteria bacterium]
MSRADRIRRVIEAGLAPERLEVVDDSGRHAGHAGARPDGETHYAVTIVAAAFAGMSRVNRQRLVYDLLADEFRTGLHALQLTTLAPGEAPRA